MKGQAVTSQVFTAIDLVQPDWTQGSYPQAWNNLDMNGGKKIPGPMLGLQGEMDPAVPFPVTSKGVNATCSNFP